jgi:hypothetical protein
VDHAEAEEREVVVVLDVAAGRDPALCFQPGVRALDRPAVASLRVAGRELAFLAAPDLAGELAGGNRIPGAAPLADPGLDPAFAQGLRERARVVAAIGPELAGPDPACKERVDERQQMAALVLVASREPDRKRRPAGVYGQVVAASRGAPVRARDLRAPFFASTSEASTITRDQSSFSASASRSCKMTSASSSSPRADHSSSRRRQVSPLGKPSSR